MRKERGRNIRNAEESHANYKQLMTKYNMVPWIGSRIRRRTLIKKDIISLVNSNRKKKKVNLDRWVNSSRKNVTMLVSLN